MLSDIAPLSRKRCTAAAAALVAVVTKCTSPSALTGPCRDRLRCARHTAPPRPAARTESSYLGS
jgi:hypothetical protein